MSNAGELQEAWGGTLFPARPAPKAHPGHCAPLRDPPA